MFWDFGSYQSFEKLSISSSRLTISYYSLHFISLFLSFTWTHIFLATWKWWFISTNQYLGGGSNVGKISVSNHSSLWSAPCHGENELSRTPSVVPAGKIPFSGECPKPFCKTAFTGIDKCRNMQHTPMAHQSVSKGYSYEKHFSLNTLCRLSLKNRGILLYKTILLFHRTNLRLTQ